VIVMNWEGFADGRAVNLRTGDSQVTNNRISILEALALQVPAYSAPTIFQMGMLTCDCDCGRELLHGTHARLRGDTIHTAGKQLGDRWLL
jgi:hypothetical protein